MTTSVGRDRYTGGAVVGISSPPTVSAPHNRVGIGRLDSTESVASRASVAENYLRPPEDRT